MIDEGEGRGRSRKIVKKIYIILGKIFHISRPAGTFRDPRDLLSRSLRIDRPSLCPDKIRTRSRLRVATTLRVGGARRAKAEAREAKVKAR